MAQGQDPVFHGPVLDWTQDHKSYQRFESWERQVNLLLGSVYADKPDAFKARLVQLWMGNDSYPLVKMWEDAGDLPRLMQNAGDAGNLPADIHQQTKRVLQAKAEQTNGNQRSLDRLPTRQ